jgi:hypothetical protein
LIASAADCAVGGLGGAGGLDVPAVVLGAAEEQPAATIIRSPRRLLLSAERRGELGSGYRFTPEMTKEQ